MREKENLYDYVVVYVDDLLVALKSVIDVLVSVQVERNRSSRVPSLHEFLL